jgi:hypothetical protein
MPVQFDNSIVYAHGEPQTVEESFKIYSNWSKIHDFSFDDLISVTSDTVALGIGWNSTSVIDQNIPFDITMYYTVTASGHAAVVKYNQVTGDHMIFGITTGGEAVIYDVVSSVPTLKFKQSVDTALFGDVTIASRQQRFSDDETDVWHTLSMWIDGALVVTHSIYIGEADETEYKVGVAVETSSLTFTNIRVPQLTEFAEWSSIDPGESPLGGLTRSIEGRYVKFFIRYDGSMRAWRSKITSSVFTFAEGELYGRVDNYDKRQLYNHVRMTGGYAMAEFVRADLIAKYGHKFIEINNPYLLTETACRREAERQIYRMEEAWFTSTFQSPFTPLLEPEDHITTSTGDKIVSSRKWSFSSATVDQDMSVRFYGGNYGS